MEQLSTGTHLPSGVFVAQQFKNKFSLFPLPRYRNRLRLRVLLCLPHMQPPSAQAPSTDSVGWFAQQTLDFQPWPRPEAGSRLAGLFQGQQKNRR